ncbi:hypothetical protein pb186bvf_019261 [Paramecium bursaria]
MVFFVFLILGRIQAQFYTLGSQKIPCPTSCSTCSSSTQCTLCKGPSAAQRSLSQLCACNAGLASYSFDDACVGNTNSQHIACTDPYCQRCYYPGWCTLCNNSLKRVLNSTNLKCDCFPGYYDNSGTCAPCDSTCLTCTGSTSQDCTACGGSGFRFLNGNSCDCLEDYYIDTEQYACVKCSTKCQTCNTYYNQCSACAASQFRTLSGTVCVCSTGYYDDPTQLQCQKCDSTCSGCTGPSSSECTSCTSANFRTLSGSTCICMPGYGISQTQSTLCAACHSSCQTCTTAASSSSCLSCKASENRIISTSSTCVCAPGFFQQSGLCVACDQTCGYCTGTLSTQCTSCSAITNRSLSGSSCICTGAYYNVGAAICANCHYSCLTCSGGGGPTNCVNCPPTRSKSGSQCLCSNSRQVDDGTNQSCQNCHYSCLTCQTINDDGCKSCTAANRTLSFGQCLCKDGTYDTGQDKCTNCNVQCKTCFGTSQTQCLSCYTNWVLSGTACSCAQGFYYDLVAKNCLACNYKCGTCIDQFNCSTCAPNSYRTTATCDCKSTTYAVDVFGTPQCQICDSTCLTCTGGGPNLCLTCDPQLYRAYQTADKSCQCVAGRYDTGIATCQICSAFCKTCSGTATTCLSCQASQFRSLVGSDCNCIDGYYEANPVTTICPTCFFTCATCTGEGSQACVTCTTGLQRHLSGNTCVCDDGLYEEIDGTCQPCTPPCKTCGNSGTQCITCVENLFRIINNGACTCMAGYQDIGNLACSGCAYQCQTCQGNINKCLTCPANTNRVYSSADFTCPCAAGFYDNGAANCLQCSYTCQTCINSTSCTTCVSAATSFRSLQLGKCVCISGYFDNGSSSNCIKCNATCNTCATSASNCLSCSPTRNLTSGSCVCKSGYFDTGAANCIQCDQNCQECQISSTQCTQCKANSNRFLSAGKCACLGGFYDSGTICIQCNQNCETCSSNPNVCLTCAASTFRVKVATSCNCPDGFYDNGTKNCQLCDQTCTTCTGTALSCLSCNPTHYRSLNMSNQCLCNSGYFDDGVLVACQLCSSNCLTCVTTSTYCLSCDTSKNLQLIANVCQCPLGTFFNTVSGVCESCAISCSQCSNSSTNCTACNSSRTFSNITGTGQCQCQPGYYDTGVAICAQCAPSCKTCTGTATFCLSCESSNKRSLSSNACPCANGFADVGAALCSPCNYTCKTCVASSNTCTTCQVDAITNRIQSGSQCICKPGFYDNGVLECLTCNYTCSTCTNASVCTGCNTVGTFRFDNSQYGSCPCLLGFYDNQTSVCQACSYRCQTCQGNPDTCLTCKIVAGSMRLNITSQCPCQDGYFDDGQQILCQPCDVQCGTCKTTSSNCTTCFGSNRGSIPSCACLTSYYNDKNNICQPCNIKCQTCVTTATNCLSCRGDRTSKNCICQPGFYEANLTNCAQCAFQCTTCDTKADNCLACLGDRINAPKCTCLDGFYDDGLNVKCQPCDYTCATCTKLGCLTCAGNRVLNQTVCNPPTAGIGYLSTPWCSTCNVAVVNATFNITLDSIIVTFPFNVNVALNFQAAPSEVCQQVFSNTTFQSFGIMPQCGPDTDKPQNFNIFLGSQATINYLDVLQFKNNTLMLANNCTEKISLYFTTQVLLPLKINPPTLQLLYPMGTLSPCQIQQINFGEQDYDGMRSFANIFWSYTLLNQTTYDLANLQQLIATTNQKQLQSIQFDSFVLPPGNSINITVQYQSFVNLSSQTSVQLTIGSTNTPSVSFQRSIIKVQSWQKISLLIYYENLSCQGMLQVKSSNDLKISISELSRNPAKANATTFDQNTLIGSSTSSSVTVVIPSFTLSAGATYMINAQAQDAIDSTAVSNTICSITILPSPLQAQIVGGNRIQNYAANFYVRAQFKDPDNGMEWNSDPFISNQMSCIDISTKAPCQDVFGVDLKLNKTRNSQFIRGGSVNSNIVQKWTITAVKDTRTTTTSSYLILVDYDFPVITLNYTSGYNLRAVNNNEDLRFTVIPADTSTKILYSFALIYNYQQVKVENMNSNFMKFKMWDYFENFTFNNQIVVKFMAQSLKFLLPGIADVTLTVNLPPSGAVLSVNPTSGQAALTLFNINVASAYDVNVPLQYRFILFENMIDYRNANISNAIILNEFQKSSSLYTSLPSNNVIILAQIQDSQGSIKNQTLELTIQNSSFICSDLSSSNYQLSSYIIQLKEMINTQKFTQDCKSLVQTIQTTTFDKVVLQNQDFSYYQNQKILQLSSLYLKQMKKNSTTQATRQIVESSASYDSVKARIQKLDMLVKSLVSQNYEYLSDINNNQAVGDPDTQNKQNINQIQRYDLYDQIDQTFQTIFTDSQLYNGTSYYDITIQLVYILKMLSESFQTNLIINQARQRYTGEYYSVNILKMDQVTFQSIIGTGANLYSTADDQVSVNIADLQVYMQIYKFNQNIFSLNSNFTSQLSLLENKTTNNTIKYELPQITNFTMYMTNIYNIINSNNITISTLPSGKMSYFMGTRELITNYTQFEFRCYSQSVDKWVYDKCLLQQSINSKNQTNYYCECYDTNPVTLVAIKSFNESTVVNVTKPIIVRVKQQEIYEVFMSYVFFGQYIIYALIAAQIMLLKRSKDKVIQESQSPSDQNNEKEEKENQELIHDNTTQPPSGLTNVFNVNMPFAKANLKFIHEISAIFLSKDRLIDPISKLIILQTNISFIFVLSILLFYFVPELFMMVPVALGSVLLQILTKIIEALLTTKFLKPIGYFLLISFQCAQIVILVLLGVFIDSEDNLDLVIVYLGAFIICYTVLECIIVFAKIFGLFTILKLLDEDRMNPGLHIAYFFLQNDTLSQLFDQQKKI